MSMDLSNVAASMAYPDDSRKDWRNIKYGRLIPTESYADQPKVVFTEDGAWLCCITTGIGLEGEAGQHVVTVRSTDEGRTWTEPAAVEPPDGPEASYACLLKVPSGRIYCFYNHNSDNIREIAVDPRGLENYVGPPVYPDGKVRRVDSIGYYVFKFSDDNGKSWGSSRYVVPVRETEIDRQNVYSGTVRFHWNVANPFVHEGSAYVSLHKVGGFGPGFFIRNEGILLKSSNILTESDPGKIVWETLPDGEIGIRAPEGAGPISGEHSYVVLSDGSFYSVFRTISGYSACAYSRDGGHIWSASEYARFGEGRRIKNPRAATFAWKTGNGRYLYWFHNHGGPAIPAGMRHNGSYGYEYRNPAWLCSGREVDTDMGRAIRWSEPEIVLYDDDPFVRISYPDCFEAGSQTFIAETQKNVARIHPVDARFLEILFEQSERKRITAEGLVAEYCESDGTIPGHIPAPEFPPFLRHDQLKADFGTENLRTGLSLEIVFSASEPNPGQTLLDSMTTDGKGLLLSLSTLGRLSLLVSDGQTRNSWLCDSGSVFPGRKHHVTVIIDVGPRVILYVFDGRLQDGGEERQFGWGRLSSDLQGVNGAREFRVSPDGGITIHGLRIYDRPLMVSEAVGNYRAETGM